MSLLVILQWEDKNLHKLYSIFFQFSKVSQLFLKCHIRKWRDHFCPHLFLEYFPIGKVFFHLENYRTYFSKYIVGNTSTLKWNFHKEKKKNSNKTVKSAFKLSDSQNVVTAPPESISSGNFLEKQSLKPTPGLLNMKALEAEWPSVFQHPPGDYAAPW